MTSRTPLAAAIATLALLPASASAKDYAGAQDADTVAVVFAAERIPVPLASGTRALVKRRVKRRRGPVGFDSYLPNGGSRRG